jgi:hypothetical protein
VNGIGALACTTAVLGWCLMVAVGVLHGAGAVGWTLSYDEAVVLVALLVDPLLVLAASVAVSARGR